MSSLKTSLLKKCEWDWKCLSVSLTLGVRTFQWTGKVVCQQNTTTKTGVAELLRPLEVNVMFCLCKVFYWFSKCVVFMPTLRMCSAQQAVYLFNIVKNFENFFNIWSDHNAHPQGKLKCIATGIKSLIRWEKFFMPLKVMLCWKHEFAIIFMLVNIHQAVDTWVNCSVMLVFKKVHEDLERMRVVR